MSLSVRDLTVSHDRRPAVHHVSFELPRGGLLAVVGPNGAGKSTLLRAIAGVQRAEHGHVEAGGRIALLPQQAGMDRAFPLRCRDAVLLGLWSEGGAFGRFRDDGRVEDAMAAVGLRGFAQRPVASLSTGQFQRLLFARLLLQDAPVILLDEPFNALDARTAADLLGVVRRWHGEGRTVCAVLHDLDLVRDEFPHTLLLARDLVAFGPTGEALSAANRLKARQMAEGWDPHAETCARAA